MGLATEIAQHLRNYVSNHPREQLPAARDLCCRFKASRVTVSRAVALLKEEGLIDSRGRGGLWPVNAADPTAPAEGNTLGSVDMLYSYIREGISNGVYPPMQPLPKIDLFCRDFHITGRTVRAVYDRLVEERIAHRSGKKWIVGKPRVIGSGIAGRGRPVVAILMPREHSWRDLCYTRMIGRFGSQFARLCEQNGIRTYPLLASDNPPDHLVGTLPAGRKAARVFLKSLEGRLMGALIVGDRNSVPDFDQWVRLFASTGRNVVIINEHVSFNPVEISALYRNVFLCHLDINKASSTIVEALAQRGNSLLGTVRTVRGWHERDQEFIEAVSRAGANSIPEVTLEIEQEPHRFWEDRPDGQTPAEVIRRLKSQGIPAVRRMLNNLIKTNPNLWDNPELNSTSPDMYTQPLFEGHDMAVMWNSHILAPMFRRKRITALLALNDDSAVTYYYWMKAVGMEIPGDVSLISVGNDDVISPMPISCLDLGYDRLAYAAFHLFAGDIPIHADRRNRLIAPVSLIDRGSISKSKGFTNSSALRGQVR